ncbi:hypothetical protein FGO68_gene12655 [Halteria grandinella]|uniref:EamA domain-containing protein n=1 Tax=Halteria grandinella TaxID=5974 RepID=A0A8J8NMY6_HALGN|nr:hypothetical protein FGO68_gene12655 [Halteria grandinella]
MQRPRRSCGTQYRNSKFLLQLQGQFRVFSICTVPIQPQAPLILAVFAYLIYKEKLSALDIVNLLVSFFGVAILLTGTLDESPQSPQTSASLSELIIPAILLVAIPFNQCSLQLLLKSMRSLNELSISAWMTLFMLLFFIPMNYLTKPDNASSPFYFLSDFDLGSWLISALFGLTGVYSQTTRAKALHYEDSAKLGVLLYFQSVIQLLMDVVFLGTSFTGQQMWGVAIIFAANSAKWASVIQKSFYQAKP